MARFITTIRLHNANENDYLKLDAELKKESFTGAVRKTAKQIREDNNEEYNREGNITLHDVSSSVLRAAEKTGKKFSFTIIRSKPVYNYS